MNVVVDVIDAYSEYIGLPMMLIKYSGQIEYVTDHHKIGSQLLFEEKQSFINKFKKVTDNLRVPTVMSVSDERTHSDTFYILTPIFELNDEYYFVAAGHFNLKNTFVIPTSLNNERTTVFYNENEVDEILEKIKNLYQLLLSKAEINKRVHSPNHLEEVLHSIGNLNYHESNTKDNLQLLLEEYVKLKEIDFVGYAVKNSNDTFSVSIIVGENVYHLLDKKFYIGEGVVGKAVIVGEDFYWNIDDNAQRNEFLHRYGIFPNQLFGFTLKDKDSIDKVIFVGSYTRKPINPSTNQFLKCLVKLMFQRNQKNSRLMNVELVQSLFINWIDFIDIVTTMTDKKQIVYKILDLCQTLSLGNFTCVTTAEYEFLYRGKYSTEAYEIHQLAYRQHKQNSQLKLWLNEHYIHYVVELGIKEINLYTISFAKETNMHYMTNVFEMIEKSISNEFRLKLKKNNLEADSVFEVLHHSMQDMNAEKYKMATIACYLIKKLKHILPIDTYLCTKLINICMVIPFSIDLLSKQISSTEEWLILQRYQYLKETNQINPNTQIEYQIIAFIDYIIIHNNTVEGVGYLDKELIEICYSLYIQHMQYEKNEVNAEISHLYSHKSEENIQLSDVINTLDLTSREKEVLSLLIEGMNNNELGEYLKISSHTVKNHVTNIFKKLDVADRMQATAKVYKLMFGNQI